MLTAKKFRDINLSDPFFDSLKADYVEFPDWFGRKENETAYVFESDSGSIEGFLYLKSEDGAITDVSPPLPPKTRIKVGTFKINPHGTKLGERFVKKIFDHAIANQVDEIYVTVFSKHAPLIRIFERYGFSRVAKKITENGEELVLTKQFGANQLDPLLRYPQVDKSSRAFLLSLWPQWHTRLLPDSILRNESASIVEDVSHANSIHKVYLAGMGGMEVLMPGDNIVIYRTSDEPGRARFRAVVTSVCVVEEYRNIDSFPDEASFVAYCDPYSIFTSAELSDLWRTKRYPHVIRFTYNIALPRRLTRGHLLDTVGLEASAYWGFMRLTSQQFEKILEDSGVNENLVVN